MNRPARLGSPPKSEHKRYLTKKYAKKPVIVMNYPKAIKAFYMRLNDDGRTVAAMDVLAPGIGEIIGGSQREERLAVLDRTMAEHRIVRKDRHAELSVAANGATLDITRWRPEASRVRSARARGDCSSPPTDRCAAAR